MNLPAYSRTKSSGVEWLGDVPEHWENKRIKWSALACINGVWGEEPNEIDDIICIRVADFDREKFLVMDEPPTLRAVELAQRKNRVVRKGDLLIEKSGGGEKQLVGCVVYFDQKFEAVCSNFVARMPIASDFSPRYWCYVHAALYAGRLNYPVIKQTTGIQNIDLSAYLDIVATYPPRAEQHIIAEFLDQETGRIDRLVRKKNELIRLLKEKRTALISHIVTQGIPPANALAAGLPANHTLKSSGIDWLGDIPAHWKVKKLRYFFRFVSGGTPSTDTPAYWDGSLPWVSPKDMKVFHIADTEDHVTELALKETTTTLVQPETLLLVVRSGILRHSVPVAITARKMTINQDIKGLIPLNNEISVHYTAWFVEGFQTQLLTIWRKEGATVESLELDFIKNSPLPIPPFAEQAAIAAYLNVETVKLEKMMAKVEEAIERLQEYRIALITAAVTGKIDVRGAERQNSIMVS